jgi:hypothetical protein
VILDPTPSVPLAIPKAAGRGTTDLLVKEVVRSGLGAAGRPWRRRYIVCRNEAETQKDKAARDAILAALEAALRRGDKSLVGNRGYRRFLIVLRTLGVALPPLIRCAQPPPTPRQRPKTRRRTRRRSANARAMPSNTLI